MLDPVVKATLQAWARYQPMLDQHLEASGLPDELKHRLRDPSTWILAAGCLLFLFLIAFVRLVASPQKGRGGVLLVGPCDAGKTTLFYQLRDGGEPAGTVTSMQENQGCFPLAGERPGARPVQIVDVPGHPRVRGTLERHVGSALGAVFVADSVTFVPNKTETAELLFELLSHPSVLARRTPVLLACNKSDVGVKAHTPEFIRKMLEKELDQICGTRGALGDGSRASGDVQLGRPGEPFSFEGLAAAQGIKVSLASTSCLSEEGVADIAAFIRTCVPA